MASKAERIIPLLVAASAVAVIALFFHYYYDHDLTTTYGDGVARLNRARRMLDNPSDGLAVTPLGGVALPLMSLLMLATVWMEPLYRNGIAGSGISMACFVLTCLFVCLTTRNLIDAMWHRKVAANLGALAAACSVMWNLNFIYFGTTPMAECLLTMWLTLSAYSLVKLEREPRRRRWLALSALALAVSTLCAYEAWFLVVLVVPPVLVLAFWTKSARGTKLFADIGWALGLSAVVMLCWLLLWEQLVFDDPLYFVRGAYSPHAIDVLAFGHIEAWGHLRVALEAYIDVVRWNVQDGVLLASLVGAAILVLPGVFWLLAILPRTFARSLRHRRRSRLRHLRRGFREATRSHAMFSPLYMLGLPVFYVVSFYFGWSVADGGSGELLNIRYGLTVVPFVGVGLGVAFGAVTLLLYHPLVRIPGTAVVAVAYVALVLAFVPRWEHPVANVELLRDVQSQPGGEASEAAAFLHDDYDGGLVLSELLSRANDPVQYRSRLATGDFLTEALPGRYRAALEDPAGHADWVFIGDRTDTKLAQATESVAFVAAYRLAFENAVARIYVKRDRP